MILIDPELEPDPAPASAAAAQTAAPGLLRNLRLPSARTLSRFLAKAQAAIRLRGQVTVLLTTDRQIRRLNRRFRGKDKPTDVLSFPATPLRNAKPAERVAGDVAIGVPTARRQGAELGHSLAIELKVLILHGLLHLAGYDHETDSGQMHRRERDLRARLGLPQGLIERVSKQARPKVRSTAGVRSKSTTKAVFPIPAPAFGRKGSKALTQTRPPGNVSRREARKIAPDGVRRGTRRTQSGESQPNSPKPRRGGGNVSALAVRSRTP